MGSTAGTDVVDKRNISLVDNINGIRTTSPWPSIPYRSHFNVHAVLLTAVTGRP